jgi:hypothetical protein
MTAAEKYLIRVSFDADQVGGVLVWRAVDAATHKNAYRDQGRFAGSLHFDDGDEVTIELVGLGVLNEFVAFEIVDASVVTLPHSSVAGVSAPSPFATNHAVIALQGWSKPTVVANPIDQRVEISRSAAALTVAQASGRWEMSLVLTVELVWLRAGQERRELRVFYVDPESEVGTGIDPPWRGYLNVP